MNIKTITNLLKQNWKSGLTVALISIPLSISLAVASGASPSYGIITAVWAGLLASIFGSSNYNIIGPAGALTGILAAYATTHGAESLPFVALLSGVIIAIGYYFRVDTYLKLVPGTIMQGFSLGVALLIGLGQLSYALGLNNLPSSHEFIGKIYQVFLHIADTHIPTFFLAIITVIALFGIRKLTTKIPGAIFVMPAGMILGYLIKNSNLGFTTTLLVDKFPSNSINLFAFPTLTWDMSLITVSLAVSFIAVLETLISARIADNLTKTTFETEREMVGLSFANLASGIFGGLPATGVFMRTGLNVASGATHRISQGLQAGIVAIICLFAWKYFLLVPLAVVAGILIFTSVRMIEYKELSRLWKFARSNFYFAIITALSMILIDTVVGLLIGMLLTSFYVLKKLSIGNFELILNDKHNAMKAIIDHDEDFETDIESDVCVYCVKGEWAYYNQESHTKRIMDQYKNWGTLVLRMRDLAFMDIEGIMAFDEIVKKLHADGKDIYVTGANPDIETILLHTSHEYGKLKTDHYIVKKTSFALKELGVVTSE